MRVNRNGFLQKSLLVHLGIFPWKCGACGLLFLFRSRGYRVRPVGHSSAVDPNQSPLT